ncbi:ADAM 12 protein [Dactylosporangium sp. NPDC000521]|uniref:ADAM 12 protein n=1 Tax=Dactylosporangium sp. NPDC000521 TaxID=3363975 RepID=UPI0036CA89E8
MTSRGRATVKDGRQQPKFDRGVTPVKALQQLAGLGVTGALTVVGEPGGVIFLRDGLVNGVESPAAPSVDRLLTAAGVVDERVWETIPSRPARALVEGGHLTAAEIELCAINAMYDAAYFVLSTERAELRFAPDIEHWLGAEGMVTTDQLCDHVARQRRILDEVHPSDATDTAAVRPVLRPGLDRVLLSGLQWEIVLHADGQRTPQDLAGLLGRSAYAVTLDVRRLAAAGLLEPPQPTGDGPTPSSEPSSSAVSAPVPAAPAPSSSAVPAPVPATQASTVSPPASSAPATSAPASVGRATGSARVNGGGDGEEILPQRVPGTYTFEDPATDTRRHLPAGVSALAVLPGAIDKAPDDTLLKRIRSALQSLR